MDFLKSHNLVTVDQLVAATNASPATIRRDPDQTSIRKG
ncbi:DeoR family transcriptional regulator [Klebsiella pneumoniae subsp. pneumoniae]|nr:DeoR family transcriptional regulator [Klebsiella pneumoniae subsp. pneumoniae]